MINYSYRAFSFRILLCCCFVLLCELLVFIISLSHVPIINLMLFLGAKKHFTIVGGIRNILGNAKEVYNPANSSITGN